jgi:hypothetical protein
MLVVGDAFVTKNQSRCILLCRRHPKCMAPDGFYAGLGPCEAVHVLDSLSPETVVTGHAMRSPDMRTALNELAQKFRQDRFSGLPAPLALRPAKGAGH